MCKHWIPWEPEKQLSHGYCGRVLRIIKEYWLDDMSDDDCDGFEPKEWQDDERRSD